MTVLSKFWAVDSTPPSFRQRSQSPWSSASAVRPRGKSGCAHRQALTQKCTLGGIDRPTVTRSGPATNGCHVNSAWLAECAKRQGPPGSFRWGVRARRAWPRGQPETPQNRTSQQRSNFTPSTGNCAIVCPEKTDAVEPANGSRARRPADVQQFSFACSAPLLAD